MASITIRESKVSGITSKAVTGKAVSEHMLMIDLVNLLPKDCTV
jgi:hypothetical protein